MAADSDGNITARDTDRTDGVSDDASQEESEDEADRRAARELEERLEREHQEELEAKRNFVLPKPIPHFSWGAFFMPPIWGAAHGQWVTILFYPLWVVADGVFRSAYHHPEPLFIVGAVLMFILMTGLTVFYAATAQRPAYWRVKDRCTPERYARQELIWGITMGIIGAAFLVLATWYNLYIYVPTE